MILIMAVATTIKATAQSVTYNHDSSKQNQITVMETGGGSLTPEFYYWLLHNNYKKTAAEKNKLGFRTLAGINLYNQVDDAEKIDSALTKRAEVEALNVADRQIDLAWLAESSKINGQLDKMKLPWAVLHRRSEASHHFLPVSSYKKHYLFYPSRPYTDCHIHKSQNCSPV